MVFKNKPIRAIKQKTGKGSLVVGKGSPEGVISLEPSRLLRFGGG